MKHLILAFALTFSSLAFGAMMENRPTPAGPHNISGTLGFVSGGPTISATYEYMIDDSWGPGGYLRYFPKHDSTPNASNGITIVGASASHHFYKKNWDLSFTPGIAIINIDAVGTGKDVTTLGPSFGIGLLCQINSSLALGVENDRYWVWFDSDYAGELRDDFSAKIRFTF